MFSAAGRKAAGLWDGELLGGGTVPCPGPWRGLRGVLQAWGWVIPTPTKGEPGTAGPSQPVPPHGTSTDGARGGGGTARTVPGSVGCHRVPVPHVGWHQGARRGTLGPHMEELEGARTVPCRPQALCVGPAVHPRVSPAVPCGVPAGCSGAGTSLLHPGLVCTPQEGAHPRSPRG